MRHYNPLAPCIFLIVLWLLPQLLLATIPSVDKSTYNSIANSSEKLIQQEAALTTCSTLQSGDWTDPSIWSCGQIPQLIDNVVITTGHVVNIPANMTVFANTIRQDGQLTVGLQARIQLGYSPNLVAYYPFNGNSDDESGNCNSGIAFGTTLTTNRFEQANTAQHFTNGSFIALPSSRLALTEFTYAAWVKYDELPQNGSLYTILNIGGNNGDHDMCLANTTVFGWGIWSYGPTRPNSNYIYEGTLPTDNSKWYHVVATRNDKYLRIYVDGQLKNEKILTENISYGTNIMARIGCRIDNTFFMQGTIDDVRIYNRMLTAEEVALLYYQ